MTETHTLPGGNRAANAHVALAFSTGSKRALEASLACWRGIWRVR